MAVAAQPSDEVREHQLIWRYSADSNGKCEGCSCSHSEKDVVVAVAKKDTEGRKVYHPHCFDEEAA